MEDLEDEYTHSIVSMFPVGNKIIAISKCGKKWFPKKIENSRPIMRVNGKPFCPECFPIWALAA